MKTISWPTLFSFLVLTSLFMPVQDASSQAEAMTPPALLPRPLEIELALSALPKHLRAEASVYVLKRGGYVLAKEGTNSFSCLVRHHGAVPGTFTDTLSPFCYDREGSATLLVAVLDEIKHLEAGKTPQEVRALITKAWEDGTYTLPGPGVAYMLSPIFRLNGQDDYYIPHTMFYAPYKTDSEVGASGDRLDYVPFIQAAGQPSAVMVVPVGEKERAEIMEQERDLIAAVKAHLANQGGS